MPTQDEEIAELKRIIAQQQEQIATIEAKLPAPKKIDSPASAQVEARGLSIVATGDRSPDWLLPSAEDREALKKIIFAVHPGLKPQEGRFADRNMDEFDESFKVAMQWLAIKGRGPLDNKHYFSWWVDDMNQWATRTLKCASVYGSGLAAALLAWGDVDFTLPLGSQLGLAPYGWRDPPHEAGWRKVLSLGQLRAPIEQKPLPKSRPVPVQILYSPGRTSTW
ncbi:MAG TPA: hypothetical protein VNR39_12420 [Pseudolabrys sp.]|nr:hypothetical protein [Pseudolabrys sp.]